MGPIKTDIKYGIQYNYDALVLDKLYLTCKSFEDVQKQENTLQQVTIQLKDKNQNERGNFLIPEI